jgi:hypothetical protein
MADNTFLVSVANVIGLNSSDVALFYGKANTNSAFTLSMQSTDVRGGINNALLYKYMHDRDLQVTIAQATFAKDILALNVGSSIVNGSVNVLKTECITLVGGDGTLSETPIGNVSVIKADGTIVSVTPVGTTITVAGGAATNVTAIYRYADTVDTISVGTTTPPTVIKLIMTAEVRNQSGTLVEYLQIEIPNFQVDGNYELAMTPDGTSSESLTGMALSTAGATCASGDVYAYVRWIPVTTTVTYTSISTTPNPFQVAVGDLPATQQLSVIGIRGGLYANTPITTECTYAKVAGGDVDITVNASSGLVTVAGTAIANDTATIEITKGSLKDYVVVTVIA